GNLTILGGDGANEVAAFDLTVGKNFSITNGTNTAGWDMNELSNLNVGGSLTIADGDGNTQTIIDRTSTGISTIARNLTVTNGAGADQNIMTDTNVGGNLTFANGPGNSAGFAGTTQIYNNANGSVQSLVGGNASVSYLSGNGDGFDEISDLDIRGNVSVN